MGAQNQKSNWLNKNDFFFRRYFAAPIECSFGKEIWQQNPAPLLQLLSVPEMKPEFRARDLNPYSTTIHFLSAMNAK